MLKKINRLLFFLIISTHNVFAHEASGGGLINGLMHPVFGPDHLLAMVAVGIISAQIGGRAIWTIPTTFVSVMLIGGILGMMDVSIMGIEFGIALSVLILGIAIALDNKIKPVYASLFVAFFAIFHGHAHGTEMPNLAQPLLYALGFVIATATLHITGVLIGLTSKDLKKGPEILRFLGAGVAGIGFAILFGL
ncbi:urease accessory protein UreJ [Candidatus Woesearchaeota archaeon]|nr:MAG: urease accessory protein UreJ [Candidatus Woesearchaeota archaeon]